MPQQEKHADPESLHGQLQRGRGEGARRILSVPRPEAWDLLVDCICNDPRLEHQVERRAQYYALMAIETDLDLKPLFQYLKGCSDAGQEWEWDTHLAMETLGELAKRGYKDAADIICEYVGWGPCWEVPLMDLVSVQDPDLHARIARRIEERFPSDSELEDTLPSSYLKGEPWTTLIRHSTRIGKARDNPGKASRIPVEEEALPADLTSLSAKQLLELVDDKNSRNRGNLAKAIRQVAKPSDIDLLVNSVSLDKPFVSSVALEGLAQLAPPSILSWLLEFWSTISETPGFVLLRDRTSRAIIALPPALTLPFAREQLYHEEWKQHALAEWLFEAHATAEDIPLLRHAIADALPDDKGNIYRLCSLFEAFSHLPDVGLIPELLEVFVRFRYSYGRASAAEAIDVTAPSLFQKKFALECLWDCEDRARFVGAATVPLENPEAMLRLRQLASDVWEYEDVRAEARKCLPGKGIS